MISLNKIKDTVVPLAKKYEVQKIYVFGSYARGDQTDKSDVDLIVETGQHPLGLFKLAGLEMDIETQLGVKVDLVTEGGLFEEVKSNIEKDRILVYEK